jgi:outer membrane protein assembly factor BamB
VKTFKVPNVTSGIGGARFDVTPSGRILVAQYSANKVVEYDQNGKEVWQATVQSPASVMRLSNGRTLVGSSVTQRVIELDRNGREVWEFKAEGRVMSVRKR